MAQSPWDVCLLQGLVDMNCLRTQRVVGGWGDLFVCFISFLWNSLLDEERTWHFEMYMFTRYKATSQHCSFLPALMGASIQYEERILDSVCKYGKYSILLNNIHPKWQFCINTLFYAVATYPMFLGSSIFQDRLWCISQHQRSRKPKNPQQNETVKLSTTKSTNPLKMSFGLMSNSFPVSSPVVSLPFGQWLFLVPLKGGRWHIIPQLAVYTTYIPLIYCLLVGYMLPTTF